MVNALVRSCYLSYIYSAEAALARRTMRRTFFDVSRDVVTYLGRDGSPRSDSTRRRNNLIPRLIAS